MDQVAGWLIASGLALGGLVMKIYPPPAKYRPYFYALVALLLVLGIELMPAVRDVLNAVPGAALVVFLVSGAVCAGAYVMTAHRAEPPAANSTPAITAETPPVPARNSEPPPPPRQETKQQPKKEPPVPDSPDKENKPAQSTSGNNSPIITQAPGSISQFGNNNQVNVFPGRPQLQISLTQRAAVTQSLRRFAGQKAKLFLDQGNPETGQFMQALADAMRDAGIEIAELNFANMLFTEKPTSFLYFYVNKEVPGMLAFAEGVIQALAQAGIAGGNFDAGHGNNQELVIWVRRP